MLDAYVALIAPWPLLYLAIGTALGIVIGSIPGLTASMLIALTLPLTFQMDATNAMTLLIGEYVGGISGGLIAATLLRMPGTPASIMTTFDAFPMAQRGEGERALGLAVAASFFGGLVSWGFLAVLSPPLARLALTFGPWEYFTLVLMALVMLASLSQGSLLKGLIGACLGMLFAMPGIDPSIGQLRLTFGFNDMTGGLNLLPVLIGTFAVSQIIKDVLTIDVALPRVDVGRGVKVGLGDVRRHGPNALRSAVIGTWVGLLPGIGANIAAMLAYATARQVSREPEKFGTGHEPGVVAAETANNASIGGALIPLITMGIPGSVTEAILIGALIIHNLQPGPLLFATNPEVAYGVIASYLGANLVMVVFMLASIRWIARLMYLPRPYLVSAILMFCVVGAFALNNRFFDVWVMLAFGAIGYFLERAKVPLGPFVIGFVLAPIAEEQFRAALMSSAGDPFTLFTRPFATVFFFVSMATLSWPFITERLRRRRATSHGADRR
ncbi:tripartite tricarboxylate transporter permease [Acuticoccus mangrovi]|uniref:Tripartite tricarboxylate transporter permease n=1 Tax=Acuticoccus mangrovi TaxID=2796142 RepID=A0A934MBX4_9HYPH|nr:tripartite tricarboxylate transporter permease [Acuticoccus mangrovi]MBJ3774627.1 tripartite tricarboxylate transporter permease [Acuticoccus mangrovi]